MVLMQIILERRAREDEPPRRAARGERLVLLRPRILDAVALVKGEITTNAQSRECTRPATGKLSEDYNKKRATESSADRDEASLVSVSESRHHGTFRGT